MDLYNLTQEQKREKLEILAFYRDCQEMLNELSFDEKLNMSAYKAYKEIERKGHAKCCNNCMYKDISKGCCFASDKQRIFQKLCWKAKNVTLLKEKNMYGEKQERITAKRAYRRRAFET